VNSIKIPICIEFPGSQFQC